MDHGTTKTELVIMGMRDNSCRERILDALMAVDGVTDASVSLLRARAVVRHNPSCDRARLVWGVVHAGYGAALATPSNGAA